MDTTELHLDTSRRRILDLTDDVEEFCSARGDGLCSVFAPHATAGLALIETGSGSEEDLLRVIGEILVRDGRWRHRHGSEGHGADHLLPAFVCPSLVVPVVDGRLALGTWQRIVLVDTNVDNAARRVRLSFLSG